MSLLQTYLENNGYDYYGNAAEDTLVFFVQDVSISSGQEEPCSSKEAFTNFSPCILNEVSGGLFSDAATVDTEIHIEARK